MAKNLKGAAAASADIFDTITRGNVQDAEAVQYVQDEKNAKDVNKEGIELARLNLKIPAEIKEYLTVAAAKASIEQRRNISLTQYLCGLVTADMEKHKDQ